MVPEEAERSVGSPATKTDTILRNSFWYGLETVCALLGSFIATVLVARILGPERIAYYSYIYWLILTSGSLGSLGVPATTRKYMAEYRGRGERGVARAVYVHSLRLQFWVSSILTIAGLLLSVTLVQHGYKLIACALVLGNWLRMIGFIPSEANNANENMFANVPGALAGALTSLISVSVSLALGWDLIGLSMGVLLASIVETLLKLRSAWQPLRTLPVVSLPTELRVRMRKFSGRSLTLLLLNLIVWERSDLVLLRVLGKNLVDLTFFSISFSLTERLLLVPQVFQGAIESTLMAEYGRNRDSLVRMVETASRYGLLLGFPLLIGASALSPALIGVIYGTRYRPVIPLLAVAALFAIPKSLLAPAQNLLAAHERQNFLIGWFACCGAWNVAADAVLIPHLGAMGAVFGNGTAQLLATLGVWVFGARRLGVRLHYGQLVRIIIPGVLMGVCVAMTTRSLPAWPGLLCGLVLGIVLFSAAIWATRALTKEDFWRFAPLASRLPRPFSSSYVRLLRILTHTDSEGALV